MEKDQFPNNDFDWIKKLKSGKFNKLKDQKLRVYQEGPPKIVKLNERIEELGIDQRFLQNNQSSDSSKEEESKQENISSESDKN